VSVADAPVAAQSKKPSSSVRHNEGVNENHKQCGSDQWRALVRESILPWALDDVDLGDDVLEVGPGYGATTDVLAESVAKLTAVEIDEELTRMLTNRFAENTAVVIVRGDATALEFPDDRFSGAASFTMLHHVPTATLQDRLFTEVARVLRSGGIFVLGDSLASPELEAHHEGDTYNPVDPDSLTERLAAAGFVHTAVKINPFGWSALARRS
jgi:SAM-dependent methyltransferase